ncbi:uncharacterized protein LOC124910305 [Impatiens glandulifera]|uniref:uncharacterized protein LOC124910305 n=1 Tax=Impatiens glandulifera TaxID=253017 RepID=UPI001FB0B452|nr:uncharacterized protein LOC124910305 [Impatiens glandulifera]
MTEPISNYPWPPHFRQSLTSEQPPQPPPSNPADAPPQVSVTGNLTAARDGRVSKPVRRRTRASRRTPTTLLSTDTRNFRAMVQQFTGGPSVSLAPFMSQATPPATFSSVNPTAQAPIDAGYFNQLLMNRRPPADDQNYQMLSFAAANRAAAAASTAGDYQIQNQNQDSGEMGTSGFSMDDLISHHQAHHPRPPSSN